MKSRKLALTLIALALTFTTACGSDDGEKKPDSESSATTSASAKPSDKATTKTDKKVELPGEMSHKGGKSTNDGDRPSAADLAKSLQTKNVLVPYKITEKQAKCVAEIVVDSDLSDGAIRALVGKDVDFKASDKDVKILRDLNKEFKKECLS